MHKLMLLSLLLAAMALGGGYSFLAIGLMALTFVFGFLTLAVFIWQTLTR